MIKKTSARGQQLRKRDNNYYFNHITVWFGPWREAIHFLKRKATLYVFEYYCYYYYEKCPYYPGTIITKQLNTDTYIRDFRFIS